MVEDTGGRMFGIDEQEVISLVTSLVGPGRGAESAGDLTPSSSMPGTPAVSQMPLGGLSAPPLLSGRASRMSDAGSERMSLGTTLAATQSGTDHVMDRCG